MVINMITSNKLKIVAFISMLIDHFGLYFYYAISENTYIMCRSIGRIAMPIFVYLLVQGYFNTKSIKKYKIRLLIFAIITQIIILAIKYINVNYYSFYSNVIYEYLNILFSFFLSINLIYLIDRKIIYINKTIMSILDKIIRVILICIIIFTYNIVPIDYNFIVPLFAVALYIIEKLREYFEYEINCYEYKVVIISLFVILIIFSSIIVERLYIVSIFSLIFIALYNGELGIKSKVLKNSFYILFPLQHALMYLLAILMYNKLM